jgi:hypothetical protein
MSDAAMGSKKPEGSGRPAKTIEVTDLQNNTTTSYNSIREAARALILVEALFDTILNLIVRNLLKRYICSPIKSSYSYPCLYIISDWLSFTFSCIMDGVPFIICK